MKHQDFMIKMVSMVHKRHIQTIPSQIIFPHVHNMIKNNQKIQHITRRMAQKIASNLDQNWRSYDFSKIDDQNEIKIWKKGNEISEINLIMAIP